MILLCADPRKVTFLLACALATIVESRQLMILDDVFAELNNNHNVPLQDLNAVTLQTLLELLQKARAERTEHEQYRLAAEQKVTHLDWVEGSRR